MKKIVIALALLSGTYGIQARLYTPETRGSFFKVIDGHDLAVVDFVDYDQSEDKPQDVETMQDAFLDLQDDAPYDDLSIAFVGINVRKAPSLRDSVEGLKDLMKDTNSVVMLFSNGKPVLDADGKIAALSGGANKRKLNAFIDTYFGQQVDTLIAQAKKAQLSEMTYETEYDLNYAQPYYAQSQPSQPQYVQTQYAQPQYVEAQPRYRYVQQPVYVERPVYVEQPAYRYRPYRGYYGGFRPGVGIGFGFGRGGGLGFGFGW